MTETPPIQANDAPNHGRLSVLTYDAVVHLLDWRGAIEVLRQGHQLAIRTYGYAALTIPLALVDADQGRQRHRVISF